MLPYNLRNDFLDYIFISASANNHILKDNVEQIRKFMKDMVPLLHKPDDIIILEGDKAQYFYILAIGKCSVIHQNLMS